MSPGEPGDPHPPDTPRRSVRKPEGPQAARAVLGSFLAHDDLGRGFEPTIGNIQGGVLMKLYFAPGACSLSPHIVLREAGYDFELEQVNNQEKKTKSGKDYWGINAKGQVPVLELDNGERITEGPVVVQYLADQKPASGLAPANGTMERVRVQEWLNFTTSEIHKTFGPIFRPLRPTPTRTIQKRTSASPSGGSERHSAANNNFAAASLRSQARNLLPVS